MRERRWKAAPETVLPTQVASIDVARAGHARAGRMPRPSARAASVKERSKGKQMAVQKTYTMIKPDGVRNGHIGEIVNRFERAGLTIERMEMGMVSEKQARANYAEHEGKPFYEGLVSYITSGPVVKMVVSGEGAVAKCRSLMGATNPAEAAPGTIRGDFGLVMDENVIHGSDSPESAEREIGVFFPEA